VFAPFFNVGDLIVLLVVEQVALALEIVWPIGVPAHSTNIWKQAKRLNVVLLKLGLIQTSIDVESKGFGIQGNSGLLPRRSISNRVEYVPLVIVVEARVG